MHASVACLLGPLPSWCTCLARPLIAFIQQPEKDQHIVHLLGTQQYKKHSANLENSGS